MFGYVAIALLAAVVYNEGAAYPLRLTIDCGSHERNFDERSSYRKRPLIHPRFNVDSFCDLIHGAIPKAVKDGRFILRESDPDQTGYGNTLIPMSAPPPEGFVSQFALPRFKNPRLKVPKMNVPKLRPQKDKMFTMPRVASSMSILPLKTSREEESSSEKMEKFKKGVQKLLHVVKVLGQIDQYLSERTRIVIDKLARTFAD